MEWAGNQKNISSCGSASHESDFFRFSIAHNGCKLEKMIEPTIYTLDEGKTYQIDFERTKDHVKFQTIKSKRIKFLTMDDLLKLRENIDKITIKFKK